MKRSSRFIASFLLMCILVCSIGTDVYAALSSSLISTVGDSGTNYSYLDTDDVTSVITPVTSFCYGGFNVLDQDHNAFGRLELEKSGFKWPSGKVGKKEDGRTIGANLWWCVPISADKTVRNEKIYAPIFSELTEELIQSPVAVLGEEFDITGHEKKKIIPLLGAKYNHKWDTAFTQVLGASLLPGIDDPAKCLRDAGFNWDDTGKLIQKQIQMQLAFNGDDTVYYYGDTSADYYNKMYLTYYCGGKYLYIYFAITAHKDKDKENHYNLVSVAFVSDLFIDFTATIQPLDDMDDEDRIKNVMSDYGYSAKYIEEKSELETLFTDIVTDTISSTDCLNNIFYGTVGSKEIAAVRLLNSHVAINPAKVNVNGKQEEGVVLKFRPAYTLRYACVCEYDDYSAKNLQRYNDKDELNHIEEYVLKLGVPSTDGKKTGWKQSQTSININEYFVTNFWFSTTAFAWGNATMMTAQEPMEKMFFTDDEVNNTLDNVVFQVFVKALVAPLNGDGASDTIDKAIKNIECTKGKNDGEGIYYFYYKFSSTLKELSELQSLNNLDDSEEKMRLLERYYDTQPSDFTVVWEFMRCLYLKTIRTHKFENLRDFDGNTYAISSTVDKSRGRKDITEIYQKLNDYQKTVLYYEYYLKMESYNENHGTNYDSTPALFTQYVPDIRPDMSGFQTIQSNWHEGNLDAAIDHVNEFDSDMFLFTSAVTEVIRYAGIATDYALLTSLVSSGAEQGSIYEFYNADVEKFISTIFTNNGDNEYTYYQRLPETSVLINKDTYRVFFNDGVDIGNPSDGFSRILYLYTNIEYAAAILQNSEWAKANGYDVAGIESYLSANPDSTKDNEKTVIDLFDNEQALLEFLGWNSNISAMDQAKLADVKGLKFDNKFSQDLFKTIIEVHDMCEILGIQKGEWSPYIDALLEVYENHKYLFEALRENIYLYQKGEAGNSTVGEPMGMFFKLGDGSSIEMTDEWMTGFAASALFVPLETNLYDANSLTLIDNSEWIANFYYKYGFYRKALMINTDNSILVNQTITNSTVGGTRYATLRDLMNYDRDIVLYVDDNFYNADKLADMLSSIDYVSVRNYNPATDTNTDETASENQKSSDLSKKQQVQGIVRDVTDLQPDIILKTGENVYYSTTLAEKVTKLDESDQDSDDTIADAYLLSAADIIGTADKKSVFAASEYSVQQSYGVVSSVYRSKTLYNATLHGIVTDNAIFKSSKGICNIAGTTARDWRSIYNYAMLANMNEQMHNDSASQLDLDAPLFCDIFGNVITESGLVIIPAAANATLCKETWNPYCIGFAEYYSNGNYLNISDFNNDDVISWLIGAEYTSKYNIQNTGYVAVNGITDSKKASDDAASKAGGFFVIDSYGNLLLKEKQLQSNTLVGIVNWNILNKNSKTIQQLFFNDAYFGKAKKLHEYMLINLICEVMRGAPIEYIDYAKEGINKSRDISKYGVYAAYKLEEVADALIVSQDKIGVGNTMISVPNISYIPGIEGIMLYVYKAIFALTIIAFVISLYLDATKNSLGIKTVTNFLLTMFMVIVGITLMPKVLNWSYYGFNKYLLHDEAAQILMLNYVKEFDGSEIGVTKITTPETNTTMYLKVGNLDVKWWDICGEILFGNATGSIKEMYANVLKDDPMATQKNVIQRSDGLYIEMQDIFDSTNTMYSPGTGMLSNYVTDVNGTGAEVDTVASFVVPYYVILDQMVANINEYNYAQSINSYSYSIGSNGHITTYDVISPYFRSGEFLEEGYDITGLFHVYKDSNINQKVLVAPSVVEGDQYKNIKQSLWYIDAMENNSDVLLDRLNELENYARQYIAANEASLGKVPDEVFLKVFAMQLAIKYNQIFGVTAGNAIEIINVDTRDLLRFMIASPDQVYRYYSYSFARFVYEQGGGIAVIFSALLITAVWISSLLKPILLIAFFALLCINIILRKLVFQKENKAIQGYLIGCGALALFNGMYAVMLKCCMLISHYNLGTVLALLLGVIVQIGYVGTLILLLVILMKDYKNNGFAEFSTYANAFTNKLVTIRNELTSRMVARHNSAYAETADSRRYRSSNFGPNSVNEMLERDREREERGNFSPV